jgi:hypothetical protein
MAAALDRLANIPIMKIHAHMNGKDLIINEGHVELRKETFQMGTRRQSQMFVTATRNWSCLAASACKLTLHVDTPSIGTSTAIIIQTIFFATSQLHSIAFDICR